VPTARQYKQGSVIYFTGDRGTDIFVLKTGKVKLQTLSIETGEEETQALSPGEFFGVKSALGHYPREEDAITQTDAVILIFKPEEFEKFVAKNFNLMLKMLKVFSGQLRRIGRKVRSIMQTDDEKVPSTELFNIGEYYFSNHRYKQSMYIFNRYISLYPNGEFVAQAQQRIEEARSGAAQLDGASSINAADESMPDIAAPSTGGAGGTETTSSDMSDALADLEDIGGQAGSTMTASSIEPDSPLARLNELSGDDAPMPGPAVTDSGNADEANPSTFYYEGLSLFSQEDYAGALEQYKSIETIKTFKNDKEAAFAEKGMYEVGRCYMHMKQYTEAIDAFTHLIRKYPRSEMMKEALLNIGSCYEETQNYQKAINFFQKVTAMPPRTKINALAKKKLDAVKKAMEG